MSFSSKVKEEITKIDLSKIESETLLTAFAASAVIVNKEKFEIHTENMAIARYLFSNFKKLYNINLDIADKKSPVNKKIIITLSYEDKNFQILKSLSIIDDNNKINHIPKNFFLDSEEKKRAYIKGCFMASGSINDPKTARYHLEIFVGSRTRAIFLKNLLNEYFLNSKYIKRERGYILYIKEAEKIGDFLRIIGATNSLLYFEDIRIYRDLKNMTNRLNNCEQANVEKKMLSSNKQIKEIQLIEETIGLDVLDDKTKELSIYRLKYPDTSLQELSEIMSMETENMISKSGINHRFRKISEIAKKIRNN